MFQAFFPFLAINHTGLGTRMTIRAEASTILTIMAIRATDAVPIIKDAFTPTITATLILLRGSRLQLQALALTGARLSADADGLQGRPRFILSVCLPDMAFPNHAMNQSEHRTNLLRIRAAPAQLIML
jgi:hypothetical protein